MYLSRYTANAEHAIKLPKVSAFKKGGYMTGATAVQVVAGVLALFVLGIIVYRRKNKA